MVKTDKQKYTSYISILIRVIVAAVACWLIFGNVDIVELGKTFRQINVLLFLLSLAVFVGGLSLIGLRWWVFLRAQNILIPLSMAVKLTYLGQFFNNFMPSAVGGDLIRAWYISRQTHKKVQAALGVAADRAIGLISTFILASASYLIFMRGRVEIFHAISTKAKAGGPLSNIHFSWENAALVVTVIIGVGFVLTGLFDVTSFFKKIYRHFVDLMRHAREVFSVYIKSPQIFFAGLGITIMLQSVVILSFWLLGRNLGIQTQIQFYFVFFPLMWVIGSLPLSIAGIGILEGGLVLLFVQFTAAEQEAATALAFCQRFIWLLASLPGMAVHLSGAHRRNTPEY